MAFVFLVAGVLSATEICRPTGDRHGVVPPGSDPSRAQCLLCPSTVSAPPRPNTTYIVNERCDWETFEPGTLAIGAYTMAAHQQLVSLQYYKSLSHVNNKAVVLSGALRVNALGCAVYSVTLTSPLTAKGVSVAGLDVYNVHVASNETAVLILNEIGKDTVDAANAQIRQTTSNGVATVGMVHVKGPGILVNCNDSKDIVAIQTFLPTDPVTILDCHLLNLTSLFDVMGNAATSALYDTPLPEWLVTLQNFNVRGTGWLILITALYFVVKPPAKPKRD